MKLISGTVAGGLVALSTIALGPSGQAATESAPALGHVVVIQAVPDTAVDVSIDGESVQKAVEVGTVLGPYDLAPGSHEVEFTDDSGEVAVTSTLEVASGASSDVVLHRPAEIDGEPVVNSYETPLGPIGPDKSRVLIAHTATVAPADVRVDGETVFTNIANGEYAEADVPAGAHEVELLPTGQTTEPILGPLSVTLEARTVTMVYAVGSPTNRSMNVIAHTATLAADGSLAPVTIDTGSAGLAADLEVDAFLSGGSSTVAESTSGLPLLGVGVGVLLMAGAALRARRTRSALGAGHGAGRRPGTL